MTDPVKLSEAQWEALELWVFDVARVESVYQDGGGGMRLSDYARRMDDSRCAARKAFGLDGEEA